ncbi:MAG: hypothetical protein E7623_07830, partial [Ruminococcaceae bacterium]|nr:hypothetical protein [Oscillospiraceae bacterium]
NVSTQKNISYYGTLKALDPENDDLVYKIVKQPKNGLLALKDKNNGSYCYTPTRNFVGNDSFTYIVFDKYGNCSEETAVNVRITKAATDFVYSDMVGHWAHNAAIKLSSGDIMSGELVGNNYVFNPNTSVSREEFICLALKASGIKVDKTVKKTVFTDDEKIDPEYKPYVAAAYNRGIIKGIKTESGLFFNPQATVTRAEAAVILNNILGAEQPTVRPVFADSESIPEWAASSLYALNEIGIFTGVGEGNISPFAELNRAMTAQILCSVMEL